MSTEHEQQQQEKPRHHYIALVAREQLYFAIRQEDRYLFEIAMSGKIIAQGERQVDMWAELVEWKDKQG
jgi:hypothetical protein